MHQTGSKMQTEDLEAENSTEAAKQINKMTVNTEYPISEIQVPTSETNESPLETKTDFDEINLEDDIEKIEQSSLESSVTNEDTTSGFTLRTSDDTSPIFCVPGQNPNESIKSWLQRISEMQSEIQKKIPLDNLSSQSNTGNEDKISPNIVTTPISNPSRIVKFQDLPYMGEMTLDNSKPRRGRKPKKADICHLIYKNYGTIFPGTPNAKSYLEKDTMKKVISEKDTNEHSNRSDVQNRIISSLLEKRLTQEYKKSKEWNSENKLSNELFDEASNQNEPLNLCIRDLNHLKIRFMKKQDNTYTSEIKSEPYSEDELDSSKLSAMSTKPREEAKYLSSVSSPDFIKATENGVGPGGYIYWPNAGVFIHPMALQQQLMYYQRLAANSNFTLSNLAPTQPSNKSCNEEVHSSELRKLMPKVKPKKAVDNKGSGEGNGQESKSKRNTSSSSDKAPVKRKRSAIFIPPIPTENNTNPATEVSICKFKFTGGAKPSLQEKKMLSVDSGGNFRYYSGTGDKSMRGYEFFPRETLQQQISNTQGSSTGAFLQASGEKIFPSPPPDFTVSKINSDFLLTPDISPSTSSLQDLECKQKKRKTKKSMQREKLEQTFKEKGFLIQTQQLESAEGATYCKFRQLRKFTRYLFRSWKDYLPGNVRELNENDKSSNDELTEQESDNLSRHSSSELSQNNMLL